MTQSSYFWAFIKAVYKHGKILLLNSSLALVLLLVSLTNWAKSVSVLLVGIGLVIACFRAWLDERKTQETKFREWTTNSPKIYALAKIIGVGQYLKNISPAEIRRQLLDSWHIDAVAVIYHQIDEEAQERFSQSATPIPDNDIVMEKWVDDRTSRIYKLVQGLTPQQSITRKEDSSRQ